MSHLCKCGHKQGEHRLATVHSYCAHSEECPCDSFEQATHLEPKKECKHMAYGGYDWPTDVQLHFPHGQHTLFMGDGIKFCVDCGTPRPKPIKESLEEKFVKRSREPYFGLTDLMKSLAYIATEHFKDTSK